jgi:uncharacterized protein (TIGR02265 family)
VLTGGGVEVLDSSEELQKRRARLTPEDTCQGMYITSVLSLATKEFGPEVARSLAGEREVPVKLVPFFRYPVTHLLALADGTAHLMSKQKAIVYEEALFLVGKSLISTYFDSPVGKTMISLSGGNPHRILQIGPAAYKATFSFGSRTYTRKGEREGIFQFETDYLGPVISCGVLKCGLEISTKVQAEVTGARGGSSLDFTVAIKW